MSPDNRRFPPPSPESAESSPPLTEAQIISNLILATANRLRGSAILQRNPDIPTWVSVTERHQFTFTEGNLANLIQEGTIGYGNRVHSSTLFPNDGSGILLQHSRCFPASERSRDFGFDANLLQVSADKQGHISIHLLTTGPQLSSPYRRRTAEHITYGGYTPFGNLVEHRTPTELAESSINELSKAGVPAADQIPPDLAKIATVSAFLDSLGNPNRPLFPQLVELPPHKIFSLRLAALARRHEVPFQGDVLIISDCATKNPDVIRALNYANYRIKEKSGNGIIPFIMIVPPDYSPDGIKIKPEFMSSLSRFKFIPEKYPLNRNQRIYLDLCYFVPRNRSEKAKQHFVLMATPDGHVETDTILLPDEAYQAAITQPKKTHHQPRTQPYPPKEIPKSPLITDCLRAVIAQHHAIHGAKRRSR